MPKTCKKWKYKDRIAAELARARIGQKRHTRRPKDEVRAYLCPACRRWHLTSWR